MALMSAVFSRKSLFSILVALFLFAGTAWAKDDLAHFLNVDRYQYYLSKLAYQLKTHEKPELAEALRDVPISVILKLKDSDLENPKKFDQLAYTLLRSTHPRLQVRPKDIQWGYNFFRNKISAAYKFSEDVPKVPERNYPELAHAKPKEATVERISIQKPDDLTLDSEEYISERTTRAIFWDALENKKEVDLHFGSQADFFDRIRDSGAQVTGKLRSFNRSHNPVFIVQYPGESQPRYAITGLTSEDRLEHMERQIGLIQWKGKDFGSRASSVRIFGDSETVLKGEEASLTLQMKSLPEADRVIIGQKGAFTKAFLTASKARDCMNLYESKTRRVKERLSASQIRLLDKMKASQEYFAAYKNSSDWDRIHAALEPLRDKGNESDKRSSFEATSLSSELADITDVTFTDGKGKPKRWRLIAHLWGDEVIPVAKALKASGVKDVTYIGTAGALPGGQLGVGDLFVPDEVIDTNGKARKIRGSIEVDGSARIGGTVGHVGTPFAETKGWMKKEDKRSDAVELETAYLTETFNRPGDRLNVFLLISDVVGSEDETLSHTTSTSRRGAQNLVISTMFKTDDAAFAGTVAGGKKDLFEKLQELAPGRDTVSLYQVSRAAMTSKKTSPGQLQKLLDQEPAFGNSFLEKDLASAGEFIEHLVQVSNQGGKKIQDIRLSREFTQGSWNPKEGALEVTLVSGSSSKTAAVQRAIDSAYESNPDLKKIITVKTSAVVPKGAGESVDSDSFTRNTLMEVYSTHAAETSGVMAQRTRSGAITFSHLSEFEAGECLRRQIRSF